MIGYKSTRRPLMSLVAKKLEIKERETIEGPVEKYIDILVNDGKIIFSNSRDAKTKVDNISSWPLGRSQTNIVKTVEFDFDEYSTGTITDLINAAAYFIDEKLETANEIWIAKIYDKKTYAKTKTVIGSAFGASMYLSRIPTVIQGNPTLGAPLVTTEMTAELDKTNPNSATNAKESDGFLI